MIYRRYEGGQCMSDYNYNYVDMHGEEIRPGYTVKIGDDEPRMVYSCSNDFGEDLGINASNEAYLKSHLDVERESITA